MEKEDIDKWIAEAVEEIWNDTISSYCHRCDNDQHLVDFDEEDAAKIIKGVLQKILCNHHLDKPEYHPCKDCPLVSSDRCPYYIKGKGLYLGVKGNGDYQGNRNRINESHSTNFG